jgi:WD40 repeat protein
MKWMSVLLFVLLICVVFCAFGVDYSLYGHKDTVWEMVSDGSYLYSVGADGMLKVWDDNLRMMQSMTSHGSWARSVAVNDRYIAVGGYKPDNTIKIFDKKTGQLLYTLKGHIASVFTVYFYKDYLISGSSDNTVIIWKGFKMVKVLKVHDSWVRKVIVVNDKLFSGDESGKINVVDLKTFKVIKTYELKSMVISMDNNNDFLFVGTSKGEVYLISLIDLSMSLLRKFQNDVYAIKCVGNTIYMAQMGDIFSYNLIDSKIKRFSVSASEITSIVFLKNKIFISNRQGEIFIYSLDGKYISKSPRHFFYAVKLAIDNDYLYVGKDTLVYAFNRKSGVRVWSYDLGSQVRNIYSFSSYIVVTGANGDVVFVKDGKIARLFHLKDAGISITSIGERICIGSFETIYEYSRDKIDNLLSITGEWISALSSFQRGNENKLLIGTNAGKVYEYDFKTKKLSVLYVGSSIVIGFGVSKSLKAFFFDGSIVDLSSKLKVSSNVFPAYVGLVVDGRQIIGGSILTIDGKVMEFETPVVSIAASSGTMFVGLSNGRVFEIQDDKILRQFSTGIGKVSTLYFDDLVIAGHEDGKVSVWEYNKNSGDYVLIKILDDHSDSVKKVLKKGDLVFSSSSDRTIKVWDLKSGKLRRTLSRHYGYVWSIFIIDDYLISGGWDGKVIVWDTRTYEPIKVYETGLSITDVWARSKDDIYVSSLEGVVVKLGQTVRKRKLCDNTLWSLDGIGDKIIKIYVAGWDGIVYVLDKDLNLLLSKKCHNATVFKVAVFDKYLITAGSDNVIKTWDESFNLLSDYSNFRQSILTVAISKSTGKIITTNGDSIIELRK